MSRRDCPLCRGTALLEFLHLASVPTNVVLLFDDAEEARAWPRGSLRLVACRGCGFVFNADVHPELIEYSSRIEETQAFSPHFVAYAESLASRWMERHALRGKRILEVGCGKGEFLASLCRNGAGHAIGFDPAARPERIPEDVRGELELVIDRFDERHLDVAADALVCRHTLEHIPEPGRFLALLHRWADRRARAPVLLFEVPDVARVLAEVAFWDFYYEHCSYFTIDTLRFAFESTGFRVLDVQTVYDDQYLVLAAEPAAGAPRRDGGRPWAAGVVEAAAAFGRSFRTIAKRVEEHVERLRRDGPLVVWGGGSKGCSFLTALHVESSVCAVVDVNPHKQGKYLVGTGHPVLGPASLREIRPAHVIVMNPVYLSEIAEIVDGLGVETHLHRANDLLSPLPVN